jgi:hypothetical protein
MVQARNRNIAFGFAGAALLVLVTALSAAADHTGGAELSGGQLADDDCYVGGLLSGIPATLNTDDYAIRDHHGSRHLVCYFETASSYTAGSDPAGYDWDWSAPRRLIAWTAFDPTCVEPGGDEIGYTDAAQSRPRFVQYRTHLVMYCSWPLDELAYP